MIKPFGISPRQEINWRIDNGYEFLCRTRYLIAYVLFIYGEQMNIDKKIAELDKHIKYIQKVLKEKQDERFCLIAEKKGHKAPSNEKTIS